MSENKNQGPNNDNFAQRRKILEKALPYLIGGLWQAHDTFSPGAFISAIASQYQKVGQNSTASLSELSSIIKETNLLDVQVLGTGRLSLSLSQEQLLALLGNYLTSKYAGEGAHPKSFSLDSKEGESEDHGKLSGVLRLINRSIYAKLSKNMPSEDLIKNELEKATERNPSETWIVSYFGSQRRDFLLEPIFLSENLILRGKLRVMSVSDFLFDLTGGRFHASLEEFSESGGMKGRFIFSRLSLGTSSQKQG